MTKFGGLLGQDGNRGNTSKVVARGVAVTDTNTNHHSASNPRLELPRVARMPTFIVALDATGSMAPRIADARDSISEILRRVRTQLSRPIQVQFLCYRDYDVFDPRNQTPSKLLEKSALTDNAQALSVWLANVTACYGGDNFGEAIETALETSYQVASNSETHVNAVLLAGDEPSNRRTDLDAIGRHQTTTAHEWARRLGDKKIPVHTFVIGTRQDTVVDFQEMARLSGGCTGRLDGSDSMLNMAAMAMVNAVGGADAVKVYATQHQLSPPEKEFAARLLTGPKR